MKFYGKCLYYNSFIFDRTFLEIVALKTCNLWSIFTFLSDKTKLCQKKVKQFRKNKWKKKVTDNQIQNKKNKQEMQKKKLVRICDTNSFVFAQQILIQKKKAFVSVLLVLCCLFFKELWKCPPNKNSEQRNNFQNKKKLRLWKTSDFLKTFLLIFKK